jgi:tetratricopeptide (TPR) repeat protein
MSEEEIRRNISSALRLKLMGNEQLKTSAYRAARETYIEALKLVLVAVDFLKQCIENRETEIRANVKLAHEFDGLKAEIEEVRIQLISNLSLTEIKLEMWNEALSHSSMVLVADPLNVKALFRRSVARIRLGEQIEEALQDLKKLRERDPKNSDISVEILRGKEALQTSQKKEDEFRTAFRGSMVREEKSWISSILTTVVGKDVMRLLSQCGGNRPSAKRTD